MIFSWINALTLGAMSLYICIGIIHFLCKSRKIESFLPILLGVCGFLMLIVEPMSLGWDGKMAELSYMDGKGLIPAMFISILTADLYCYMRKRDFGKISLPDTVPASLSDVFASIVPGAVLMVIYIALYAIMNKAGTIAAKADIQCHFPVPDSSGQCWFYHYHNTDGTYFLVLRYPCTLPFQVCLRLSATAIYP